jgi:ribonuclease HII
MQRVRFTLMPSNYVFRIAPDQWEKVKALAIAEFSARTLSYVDKYVLDRLEVQDDFGRLTLTYFISCKLVIQGRPNSAKMISLAKRIEESFSIAEEKTKEAPYVGLPREGEITKEIHIGLDEAGAGETFGSLFLGCAMVEPKKLQHLRGLLGKKNIRELDEDAILNLANATKDMFKFRVKRSSAYDIDSYNKNVLLDRGYKELLTQIDIDFSKACVVVDDYGVQYELKEFLKGLEGNGSQIIVAKQADETYACVKLGSLMARKNRVLEIQRINAENVLADLENRKRVKPGTGAPSNPATFEWLSLYRNIYPYSDFPAWVRRKWENVKRIEEQLPKKPLHLIFGCSVCGRKTNNLKIRYDGTATKLTCGECSAEIPKTNFQTSTQRISIVIDTSALLTRIVSKDLKSTAYFEGVTFVLPSVLYEELDSKQPDLKKGGQAEIEYLITCPTISYKIVDVDDFRDVQKDKKFMSVVAQENAAMITMDRTLAMFSELGHLVFEIQP